MQGKFPQSHSHEKPSSVWSRMKSPLEYKQHVTLHPGSEITPPSGQAAWRLRAKEQQQKINKNASHLAKTGDKAWESSQAREDVTP